MSDFLFVHSDIDDAGLTPSEFRVLGHLARRAGDDGLIYSSVPNMAVTCGLQLKTVQKALRGLEIRGVIQSHQRTGMTSHRTINPPSKWRSNPSQKATLPKKRPGSKNGSTPLPKSAPTPIPKNGLLRLSPEGNPRKDDPITVALPFASEAFSLAWADWLKHLAQKRKKPGEMAVNAQLAKCAQWGEERAVAAIRNSIAGNYQGLFEPNGAGQFFPPAFGNRSRDARRTPKSIPNYEDAH